jgi:hypothetical protein
MDENKLNQADELFEPTVEEAILASGGHKTGTLHTPEGGESIEDLLDED